MKEVTVTFHVLCDRDRVGFGPDGKRKEDNVFKL